MNKRSENPQNWSSVQAELQAYRNEQHEVWGEVDNSLLACYLCDEVDDQDREYVEQEMQAHPELQKLTDLVRDVLSAPESSFSAKPQVEVEEKPVLKFSPSRKRQSKKSYSRSAVMLLAAACLLLVIGLRWDWNQPSKTKSRSVAALKEEKHRVGFSPEGRRIVDDMAGRGGLDPRFVRGSLHLMNNDLDAATTVLTSLASSAPTEEARNETMDRLVQVCEVAADRMQEKVAAKLMSRKPVKSFPPVPTPPPPSLPQMISGTAGIPVLGQGQSRKWVKQALPYVIKGFQQDRHPELKNRCAWTLGRVCRNSLSKEQQKIQADAVWYYRFEVPRHRGLRDQAKLLSVQARRGLNEHLRSLAKTHKTEVLAETVKSLEKHELAIYNKLTKEKKDRFLQVWARSRARAAGVDRGIYVVVCRKPATIQVSFGSDVNNNFKEAEPAFLQEVKHVGRVTWQAIENSLTAMSKAPKAKK